MKCQHLCIVHVVLFPGFALQSKAQDCMRANYLCIHACGNRIEITLKDK